MTPRGKGMVAGGISKRIHARIFLDTPEAMGKGCLYTKALDFLN
jgi:hypothetical protein